MNTQQSVFEIWNYTFLFMTLSTIAAFIVDMLGHRTKTISSNLFSLAVLAGITLGELCVSFIPLASLDVRLAIAVLLCIGVSVVIPWQFRTTDPLVKSRRANG
jgi:hypothetical protein